MLWVPTVRPDELTDAAPAASVTLPPILAPLSVNWTEPVGVPADDESAVTVAVKVTPCPKTVGGDGAALIDVVVVVPFTVCTIGSLRLVPNGVPAAAAVIKCVPPDKLDVVIDAELVPSGMQPQKVPKFGVRMATDVHRHCAVEEDNVTECKWRDDRRGKGDALAQV